MPTVEELPAALTNQEAGGTRVVGARVSYREDSEGEPAVFVELILSDPPAGMDTWPVEDVWALRRAVREAIENLDPELDMSWFISLAPEREEELDPEDTGGQVEIDVVGS